MIIISMLTLPITTASTTTTTHRYCRLFDSVLHTDIITMHSGENVYADEGVDQTLYNEGKYCVYGM
jgi:hypothetical protein